MGTLISGIEDGGARIFEACWVTALDGEGDTER